MATHDNASHDPVIQPDAASMERATKIWRDLEVQLKPDDSIIEIGDFGFDNWNSQIIETIRGFMM